MNHLPHVAPRPGAEAEARPVAFIGIAPGATGCAALIHGAGTLGDS